MRFIVGINLNELYSIQTDTFTRDIRFDARDYSKISLLLGQGNQI